MTQTSNNQIQSIPLEDIGEEGLTRFSMDPPPDTLVQSIRELGITHPILLAPSGKEYQIVCGHRRVECAHLLKLETVPALMLNDAPDPAQMLKRNLLENRAQRTYSDIEKGGIVYKLKEAGIPEAEIIKDYLPLLDLERSKKLLVDLNQCAAFPKSLKILLHELNLPLRVFSILFRWNANDQALAETLLSTLHPGVNKCRELLELTDETAVKDNTSPQEILNRKEIQTPLNNADLPINEKYDAIHKQLRLWRYPVLTDLQKQVYRAIDQLKLEGRIKLRTPENFENDQFKIELNFSSRDELIKQVEQLFRVTDSEALDELIRIFKERSTSAGN
jgi:ParB/RepB/Spo0J family partition protein